jgi:hypothetical protein
MEEKMKELMMSKRYNLILMWLNGIFFIFNVIFLNIGSAPLVNLVAGLVSLAGFMCSYVLYTKDEDDE